MGKCYCLLRPTIIKAFINIPIRNSRKKIIRKIEKKRNTKLCRNYLNGTPCKIHLFVYRCNYAHGKDKLKEKDQRNCNANYKEKRCYYGQKCTKPLCHFYHNVSSKRVNILQHKLRKIRRDEDLQSFIRKDRRNLERFTWRKEQMRAFDKVWMRQLNISSMVPFLTQFEQSDVNDLTKRLLKIFNNLNSQGMRTLLKIKLNLLQTRSQLACEKKHLVSEHLKKVPILVFKSKQFSYERNSLKRQLSYEINDSSVVSYVCSDMLEQQPHNLRMVVQSVQGKWYQFQKLMDSIKMLSKTLYKLDLDIREFIGHIEIDQIEYIFSKSLLALKNLKVINLRFEFNFLREEGNYERQFVDVILEILKRMHANSNKNLQISINLFCIVIQMKGESLQISKQAIQINKEFKRKEVNRIFNYTKLHVYFIKQFYRKFKPIPIHYLNLDFSSLFYVGDQKLFAQDVHYDYQYQKLFSTFTSIIQQLPNSSIEKVKLKFFGFLFQFENQDSNRTVLITFRMNTRFRQYNTPIVRIAEFSHFVDELLLKMNQKYSYQIFEGNCFTSKNYQKNQFISKGKLQILEIVDKASIFLEKVTDNYKNTLQIRCLRQDAFHVQKIITIRRQLTQVICVDDPQWCCLKNKKLETLRCNAVMYRHQRCLLFSLYSIKKVQERNPRFQFRSEIIKEILQFNNLYPTNKNIDRYYISMFKEPRKLSQVILSDFSS